MTEPYILFELAGALYGIRSQNVQHLEMLEHITPVPNTIPALDGVIFSRGQVIPALNLRVRFGLPREAHTARTRVIFIRLEHRVVALIVDSAREFAPIPGEAIKPAEKKLHGIEGNYVEGTATVKGRLVLLLDLAAVLSHDDIPTPDPALTPTAS